MQPEEDLIKFLFGCSLAITVKQSDMKQTRGYFQLDAVRKRRSFIIISYTGKLEDAWSKAHPT